MDNLTKEYKKIELLNNKKIELLNKVDIFIKKKKLLYSNVDIESPKSQDEKELDKQIADIFSDINCITLQRRKILYPNKYADNIYIKGK
jgi:hypothetical protein